MKTEYIKNLIREWFATLSIEELTSNQKLSKLFSQIEEHLQKLEVKSV